MHSPAPPSSTALPVVAPDAIKVTVRSSLGDGTCVFVVDAPAGGKIADVKQLLCLPPHNMCSDASTLVLVLKGKGAAAALAALHQSLSTFLLHVLRVTFSQSGSILHDDAAATSACVTKGSVVTTVILAPGCPRTQMQPQPSTAATHASSSARVAPYDSAPTATDVANGNVAGPVLSAPTSAAKASSVNAGTHSSSAAKFAAQAPAPATLIVQLGSRVRISGLQAAPDMNGRTGVVCAAFDQESGRWAVEIDGDGARIPCRGAFRPDNLRVIRSHNFSTEWVDEEGDVWPKSVDFSRECAKGHALVPLGDCGGDTGGMRLMCRLCHSFCGRDCNDAASWLTCSIDFGCCGVYAVCCSCARTPSSAAVVCAGLDDFETVVSCGVEC